MAVPRVPFLALDHDHAVVRDDALARIERVLDSQGFVLGRETDELEASMVAISGADHAVACSSGSDALLLALKALGVGPGDCVVVPAFTFFATAGAAAMAGATPCFVDVDPSTLCMGPEQLESAVGRSLAERGSRLVDRRSGAPVKAIIPVHLYGLAADVAGIAAFAQRYADAAAVIEDAAQAIGADGDGGRVGSLGAAACFSFYPTKNLGGAGDGGAVTTGDPDLATRVRELRAHGASGGAYLHARVGMNARMSELVAAYINAKFPQLAAWTMRRREAARRYRDILSPIADAGLLELPAQSPGQVYHQFTIKIAHDRDGVRARAAEAGVDTRVFYPIPLPLQPCFAYLGYAPGALPTSERAAATVLSLPMYPSLTDEQIDATAAAIVAAVGFRA